MGGQGQGAAKNSFLAFGALFSEIRFCRNQTPCFGSEIDAFFFFRLSSSQQNIL
jgi:hypothetical protein